MIYTEEQGPALIELEVEEDETILSQLVIPAVPGEYYSYSSKFTEERPVYAFMKCKANKSRPIAAIESLGREANLLFLFGNPIQVCAVKNAQALGLLCGSVISEFSEKTWIAPAGITTENFYESRLRKDVPALVEACQIALEKSKTIITLGLEMVIAMATADSGKYGMFCGYKIRIL